jgi:2-polyprenyl-3-methyl-5-hydroxy-6-metoxy-1,4-benzoquinol methylase
VGDDEADATNHEATPGAAQTEGYHSYVEQRATRTLTFRRYAAAMARRLPKARVLDVGCALGFFLEAALEHGLDAHGIDASNAAISAIRPRFGERVKSGTLASVPDREHASYDIVFASDIIEHIPKPHEFVAQVARLLKPAGEFVGITPNARSLLARISGKRWVSFKPPEHVILYTPRQMRTLLSRDFASVVVTPALQEYPATLVAQRLVELLGPATELGQRTRSALGARRLRVPDGNMLIRATKA